MISKKLSFSLWLIFLAIGCAFAWADEKTDYAPIKPSEREKCPVCGMFVAKYPDWTATLVFKDGQRVYFDGAKDFFKYYFNIKQYNPQKSSHDIQGIYLTEYYDLDFIDARKPFLVIGSAVYGPMGRELIPLANKSDALQFMKDHGGKRIVTFDEVTPKMIEQLDE